MPARKVRTVPKPRSQNLTELIRVIKDIAPQLKTLRQRKKDLEEVEIPGVQKELLSALAKVDPDGAGVVFTNEDGTEEAAYYQQNNASEFWDLEMLVPWLRKNKDRWMACSSRVFDQQKFEAEIASGNIPAKVADGFKKTGKPPAPFVRIGKPTRKSLR